MKNQFRILVAVVGMVVILASLALTGCASPAAVTNPTPNPAVNSVPVSAPDAIASSAPDKGPQEGIKVHGHWTIEVTNPDGTLAQHREFDNALTSTGASWLPEVIGRQTSVGGWFIELTSSYSYQNAWSTSWVCDNPCTFQCCSGHYEPGPGYIVESSFNYSMGGGYFKNLTVDVPTSGNNTGKLVLSGSATAGIDGQIDEVHTQFCNLAPTSPPSGEYSQSSGYDFTSKILDNHPVMLKAGQQVAVTVVISFS